MPNQEGMEQPARARARVCIVLCKRIATMEGGEQKGT